MLICVLACSHPLIQSKSNGVSKNQGYPILFKPSFIFDICVITCKNIWVVVKISGYLFLPSVP